MSISVVIAPESQIPPSMRKIAVGGIQPASEFNAPGPVTSFAVVTVKIVLFGHFTYQMERLSGVNITTRLLTRYPLTYLYAGKLFEVRLGNRFTNSSNLRL
jgi:hypothetical protein